jgi:outer membrane protein
MFQKRGMLLSNVNLFDLYFAQKQRMNRGLLILNVVLLVAIAILFYLHFADKKKPVIKSTRQKSVAAEVPKDFRIAYFEMDSIENSFSMVKDVKKDLSKEEERMNNEMASLKKSYSNKIAEFQKQAQTGMSQVQSENANREVLQLQESIRGRQQELDAKYQDLYMRKMRDVKSKIEDFLKTYNTEKRYSYILAYEPGLFYYRDTAYNITKDVIIGLNDLYKKK